MLVGTTKLDYDKIKRYCNSHMELIQYAEELVPDWLRHVTPIVHNQRYYVAISIRNLKSIPFKTRMAMVEALLDGVQLKGVMSCFITLDELMNQCNIEALVELLEAEVSEDG